MSRHRSGASRPRFARAIPGLATAAALGLASLASGCSQQQQATAAGQPAGKAEGQAKPGSRPALSGQRVEVAEVLPSVGQLEVTLPGEVEGFQDAWLGAPLGGYVERVLAKQGQRVKAGALLVSVDRETHAAREARARLEVEVATRERDRAQALGASIPRSELDAARDRVRLAEASLRELALNTRRATVRAPFSGVIVDVSVDPGEVAAPGAPIARLVQLNPVKVTVALSDQDLGLAREGARARVQLDARSGIYEGRVVSLARAADLKTRAFEAVVEVDNSDEALLPGMIASVTLVGSAAPESAKQLVIPQDWVVTRRDGVGVFVEQGGVARWRDVTLGQILRRQVVVESGIAPGDALVIVGHRVLVDGDPVLVHRRGKCCRDGRATFL